ncbi:PQQ-dependent sugar dehydrogenase [Methyloceanibacter marginalis]|uniref:PQQ-dependent sugar dehydrogenase n=1 Tax=Methyloceanibacter marginalis TaxID=1774971 RepID=UPI000A58E7C2
MPSFSKCALPLAAVLILLLGACDSADLPEEASQGANPTIPEPSDGVVPTVNVAEATSWPDGEKPTPAEGLEVKAFARNLDHPRWLHVLPNGDVLVAETNAPKRSGGREGIREWVMGWAMDRAGAAVPSPNRIMLLRDEDGDGQADTKTVFLENLNSPFGMALIGEDLYVANTDAVMRFPYEEGATEITAKGEKLADLPGGPINHHWTKSLVASPDGKHLYSGVGSNSNVAENSMEVEEGARPSTRSTSRRERAVIFASGLRNPVGLDFQPGTDTLWAVVNERDELGSDLVPDYLTSVKEGGFYGWPYSYWGHYVDTRVEPQKPELVKEAIVPDYALGNHVAPLGLTFAEGNTLPPAYASGAFVGEQAVHGTARRAAATRWCSSPS